MTSIQPIISLKTKTLLSITPDNRIHLWDLDSRRERRSYVEKNYLSHEYTCMAFQAGQKESLGTIAVGTSDGQVILWDLSRGVVVKTIALESHDFISDVTFSNDGQTIFVASNVITINQYNTTSGELVKSIKAGKKASVKVVMNPKADVIAVAGSGIRIIDIASGEKKKLDVSLRAGVSTMTFSSCGRFLLCAGTDSREIHVFDIQEGSDLKPRNIIAVDDYPISLCCQSSIAKGCIDILCGYAGKGGCIIRIMRGSMEGDNNMDDSITRSKLAVKESILSGSFGGYTINSSSTASSNRKSSNRMITIAIGQLSYPSFHQLDIESEESELLKEIYLHQNHSNHNHTATQPPLITVAPDGSTSSIATTIESTAEVTSSKAVNKNKNSDSMVLGALDMGGVKRPAVHVVDDAHIDHDNKKQKTRSSDNNDMDITIDLASAEQTLEKRLTELSASLNTLEQLQRSDKANPSATAIPTSDSLVTLIEQALQSGDNALLEQCLGTEELAIIEETCRRLSANRIISLLKRLVSKFEKSPSRGILLTRWLSSLLKYHTSFLISIPDLAKQLGGLSQMLEARLSSYSRLASLNGRLDMLMSQLSTVSPSTATKDQVVSYKPKHVFVEE